MIDPRAKFEAALDVFATPGNRWGGTSALTYWAAACGMDAEAVIDAAHGAGVRSRDADIRRGMVSATARVTANTARFTGGNSVRCFRRYTPKPPQPTDRVRRLIEAGRDVSTIEALRELSPVQIPRATDARAYLRQTRAMLVRLFGDGDIVSIRKDKADMTPATPGANLRPLADWMRQTGGHGEIVRPNPFTGKQGNTADGKPSFGAKDCIAAYRHMVFEFDEMPIAEQCRFWAGFIKCGKLPLVSLTFSGGKSIHGVVRVNAPDAETWARYRAQIIERYAADPDRAYRLDVQALNPLTGCRLAGVVRKDTGRVQEMLFACSRRIDAAGRETQTPTRHTPESDNHPTERNISLDRLLALYSTAFDFTPTPPKEPDGNAPIDELLDYCEVSESIAALPPCTMRHDMLSCPRSVEEVRDRDVNMITTRVNQTHSPHFGGLRTRAHLLPFIVRGLSCPKMEVRPHEQAEKDGGKDREEQE